MLLVSLTCFVRSCLRFESARLCVGEVSSFVVAHYKFFSLLKATDSCETQNSKSVQMFKMVNCCLLWIVMEATE
uniref:Secreted protein n=1 Tax=Arundo donax TaxID=35708 RepID=A0A0A9F8I8_ARUDO